MIPDEIADRLMSFVLCPTTGRVITVNPGDDKALCNCRKSNPKCPTERTAETGTHVVAFLTPSNARAFRRQREDDAIEREILKLGREHPLPPEQAERLYRKVLVAVGCPADELESKLAEVMKARAAR